ncbi:hypothetical protein CRG98_010351 [Punica granatum]|uniref:Glycosyltransferase family 92 protein n=1 Tax=Punica granatum TaxID=22663 RepID=A0A2I0KLA7_PUNGR|nr:hypothetical protein CRG98_010351 [Punica granatum]
MDSEQRRKRRRPGQLKPGQVSPWPQLFSLSNSLHGLVNHRLLSLPHRVEDRVLFPDHLLLLLASPHGIYSPEKLECVYYHRSNSTAEIGNQELATALPLLSAGAYDEFRSIVRCPLPPTNYSAAVDLRPRGEATAGYSRPPDRAVHSWHKVAYEAALDGDTALVFVKGLNLRPHRRSNPGRFSCHFGLGNWERNDGLILTTEAIAAAQEVVRCLLPRSIHINPSKANGIRVTIGIPSNFHGGARKSSVHVSVPSVAKIYSSGKNSDGGGGPNTKRKICACTMMWNQASSLREWIMYHSRLGVERWFIYDNNSDDNIKEVIEELNSENYSVSRHVWPWIKTQEAGFSHCVLKAREECQWVGFFDVDEFFYFPFPSRRSNKLRVRGQGSLRALVANFSYTSSPVAEIRTACHSFGPSGLTSHPPQGVTAGYTCRLQQPERHKSIIRPDALDTTLLNEVHHFRLKEGFRYLNVPESIAVINHYKYQVWETFRAKFYRRVSSYVVDWQENQNTGSKDRAPGLGTEPIEPPDWRLRFCEVWDTGLRDFVLANFADPTTGNLPWERSQRTNFEIDNVQQLHLTKCELCNMVFGLLRDNTKGSCEIIACHCRSVCGRRGPG